MVLVGTKRPAFSRLTPMASSARPISSATPPTIRLAQPTAKPAAAKPATARQQQNHQSGYQQHRATDDETSRHADLADLFRHFGASELSLFAHQRRRLAHQIREDRRNRAIGLNVGHRRP